MLRLMHSASATRPPPRLAVLARDVVKVCDGYPVYEAAVWALWLLERTNDLRRAIAAGNPSNSGRSPTRLAGVRTTAFDSPMSSMKGVVAVTGP